MGTIHPGDNHPGTTRQAVENHPPRVDDHRVAVGFPTIEMIPALRRGQHVGEIFNGARPDQGFPVRLAGRFGKGRRHQNQVDLAHRAIQLREAQVVTDGKAELPAVEGHDHRHRLARRNRRALAVDGIGRHGHIEEVYLAVGRKQLPAVVEEEAGVVGAPGVGALLCKAANKHRDAMAPRCGSDATHRRAVHSLWRRESGSLRSHEGGILGKGDQASAAGRCLRNGGLHPAEVGFGVGRGGLLRHRDAHRAAHGCAARS